MKTYARIVDGWVAEIIEPMLNAEGNEIPIEQRFHPDFVAMLVVYDPANPPTPPAPPSVTAEGARAQRDALLRATDWTQLRDVPDATAAKWTPYRQMLRDLPAQAGFPTVIRWPEMPGIDSSRIGLGRVGTATVSGPAPSLAKGAAS